MKDFSRLAVVAVFLALAAASANAFKMGWEVETDGSVMRPGSELSIKQAFHVGAYWKLTVDDPKGKYQKCFPVNAIKNGKVRLETGQDQAVSQAQPNFRQMFRFQRVRSRLGQGGSQVPSVPPPPPGPPPSLDQKPKKQQKQKQKSKAPSQAEAKCNYGFIELVSKPIKQTVADVNGALKEIGQWWKNTKDLSKSSVTVFGFGSLGYQTDLLLSTSDAKVQFTVGYSLFKLDKLAAGNGPLSKMWDGFPEAYTKVTSEFDTSAPNKNIIKNFLAVWYWVFSKYVSIQGDHIGKGQMNVNVKMDFCEWVDVMKRGGLLRDSDVEDIKTFMKKFESHSGLVGDEKKKKALGVAKGERQCFMISNDNTRVKPTVENGDVDVVVEYRINNNSPCFQLILDVYKNPASVDNDQKLNRRISQCLMDLSFPGLADEIAAYNKVIQTSVKTKESLKDADLELSEIATTQEELLKEIEKMDASQVKIGDAIVGTPAYDGLKTRVNKIKEIFNNLKVPITI